mgnify:CR=1 FL=1
MITTQAEMREHYAVRAEADKQAVFMSHELAKEERGGADHEDD